MLLEPLVYLVSAVMKVWHLFFAHVVGAVVEINPSTTWLLSIVFLVVSVRLAIFPLYRRQLINGRRSANLRPHIAAVQKKYKTNADPHAPLYQTWAIQELRRDSGVSFWAALGPTLIQIPIILGLVRMLRRMVAAASSPGNPADHGVGFLNVSEVTDFLRTDLFDVPITAYIAMPPDRYQALGTNFRDVVTLAGPLVFAAATFTGINLIISLRRTKRTTDENSKLSRFLVRWLAAMIVIAPIFLLFIGFFGPAPIAIALYWACNNLWTASQSFAMTKYLDRRYPLSEEFVSQRVELREQQQAELLRHNRIEYLRRRKEKNKNFTPIHQKILEKLEAELDTEAKKEQLLSAKVNQYRTVIYFMRLKQQEYLPSFGQKLATVFTVTVPDNAVHHTPIEIPAIVKVQQPAGPRHALGNRRKEKRARKLSKPELLARQLGTAAYQTGCRHINKATGKREYQWKRFRD